MIWIIVRSMLLSAHVQNSLHPEFPGKEVKPRDFAGLPRPALTLMDTCPLTCAQAVTHVLFPLRGPQRHILLNTLPVSGPDLSSTSVTWPGGADWWWPALLFWLRRPCEGEHARPNKWDPLVHPQETKRYQNTKKGSRCRSSGATKPVA